MSEEYHVKCPQCGAMRATTTLEKVKCHKCGYQFIAREYLTKEPVHGLIKGKQWDGFITGNEVKNL